MSQGQPAAGAAILGPVGTLGTPRRGASRQDVLCPAAGGQHLRVAADHERPTRPSMS